MTSEQIQLDKARRDLEVAEAKHAAAERVVNEQVAAANARRDAALKAWDDRAVKEFDFAQWTKVIQDERREYHAALEAWQVVITGAEYYAAQRTRGFLQVEVMKIQQRRGEVGADATRNIPFGSPPSQREDITKAIERLAANRSADIMDQREAEREAEREAAGEAAARGES